MVQPFRTAAVESNFLKVNVVALAVVAAGVSSVMLVLVEMAVIFDGYLIVTDESVPPNVTGEPPTVDDIWKVVVVEFTT